MQRERRHICTLELVGRRHRVRIFGGFAAANSTRGHSWMRGGQEKISHLQRVSRSWRRSSARFRSRVAT